ncbi:Linker for activation of T-cells family member 1 [Varanus komodoensis]|nr:Linker for activation of T-cells family member 1 [Varanus komodoensis]
MLPLPLGMEGEQKAGILPRPLAKANGVLFLSRPSTQHPLGLPSSPSRTHEESVPSYENEEQACTMDNEENDIDKYIEVLPDVPLTEQRKEDHASSDSIVEQYENIPESQRHSLGEYVNVLEAEATVLDPCFVNISDRESEDDTPDYENVRPGL